MRGTTTTVVPRKLEGDERATAWSTMVDVWPNYALYVERTARTIEVFELTPVAS